MLAALMADSEGVGPGSSLVEKLEAVQAALEADDIRGACNNLLQGYIHTVEAQTDKKIDPAVAEDLIAQALAIADALGCEEPPPSLMTGAVAAIPLALAAWFSARRRLFDWIDNRA